MKKIWTLVTIAALGVAAVGCDSAKTGPSDSAPTPPTQETAEETADEKADDETAAEGEQTPPADNP